MLKKALVAHAWACRAEDVAVEARPGGLGRCRPSWIFQVGTPRHTQLGGCRGGCNESKCRTAEGMEAPDRGSHPHGKRAVRRRSVPVGCKCTRVGPKEPSGRLDPSRHARAWSWKVHLPRSHPPLRGTDGKEGDGGTNVRSIVESWRGQSGSMPPRPGGLGPTRNPVVVVAVHVPLAFVPL